MKDKEQEQITPEIMQMNAQMNFAHQTNIVQFKFNLLVLAKDIVKDKLVDKSIEEVYLDLREEVLGIPDPNKVQKEKLEV